VRRAEVTGMGLLFGKTMHATSVAGYSDQQIKDIGRIYPMPIDGVTARPLDLFERTDTLASIFDYIIPNGKDDHVVLLHNMNSSARSMSVDFGEDSAFGGLELDPAKKYDIWDFWDWKYIGRVDGDYRLSVSVRPNEMKTLAVREVDEPRILSTNRHLLQGEVDTENVSFDAGSNTLSGTLKVVGDDEYKAIVMLPDQYFTVDAFTVNNGNVTATAIKDYFEGYIEITVSSKDNAVVDFELKLKESTPDSEPPPKVTGFIAEAKGMAIYLSWLYAGDSAGRYRYELYRGDNEDFAMNASTLLNDSIRINQYVDPTVSNATVYYYKIAAYDVFGNKSGPAMLKVASLDIPLVIDSGTGGNWAGNYGGEGYIFFSEPTQNEDLKAIPDYLDGGVAVTGASRYREAGNGYCLQLPGSAARQQGMLFSYGSISFTLKPNDNITHSVALYMLDWRNEGRSFTLDAVDAQGAAIIPTVRVGNHRYGCYVMLSSTIRVKRR